MPDTPALQFPFLGRGGEMGARVRAFNWSATSLGPIEAWSPVLRTAVTTMLNSPMLGAVVWGPDFILMYNDAYAPILADRHPRSLGQPMAEVWGEIWPQLSPPFLRAFETGEAATERNFPALLTRNGRQEQTYWDFTVSPIRDDTGTVLGLQNYAVEITKQLEAEKRRAEAEAQLQAMNVGLLREVKTSSAALNVTQAKLGMSEAALLDARTTAELREQFIAVLGHDLRNPLSAISGAAYLIAKTPLNERATKLIDSLQSSILRMTGLIDNVLDFARGRLGSGLTLSRDLDSGIEATLRQAVEELRIIAPDREIVVEYDLTQPVDCDRVRIAQLFSNLLGNALTHGATTTPIRVYAATIDDTFELSVANGGAPISPAAMERLFQPFYRGAVRPSQQGLGLGLFIASEIACAHHGTLIVASDRAETRFTLRMPLHQDERDDLERPD